MKTPLIAASLAALCASGSVCAQSSVTLYGIIDEGLTFSNNQLGNKAYQMQSGISQGSRWGMQGAEDLGGGLSAIFRLENGFDINTGKLGQQGREFGRAAYVGVSSKTLGTVTLGRQNELMGDYVGLYTANGNFAACALNGSSGPLAFTGTFATAAPWCSRGAATSARACLTRRGTASSTRSASTSAGSRLTSAWP